MNDLIEQFTQDIQFDALEGWCRIFDVPYDLPLTDDEYPDWDMETRANLAETIIKKFEGANNGNGSPVATAN